jgi:hypothetical protein
MALMVEELKKGLSVSEYWIWLLLLPWLVWWLWCVNWNHVWAVLAQGAWVPAILLMIVAGLVWSQIAPSDCTCLGFVKIPNFWWQLGAMGLLAAITLLCGWLQSVFGWTPAEVNLEPAAGDEPGHHERQLCSDESNG